MYFENLIQQAEGNVYFIAEACDNHMGSFEYAKALARAAKECGCDAVKYQHHIVDEEMLRAGKMSENFDQHLSDFLDENALSLEQHLNLKKFCQEIGIQYLCTPFSFQAAYEIFDFVPFFKIGSGEFLDRWFIDKLANLGKPVLFSSGMCTYDEMLNNIDYLIYKGLNFALMNCLSEYPPKYEDLNLEIITNLKLKYKNLIIGHSDHTKDIGSCLSAITLGATIIEKHLTLSSYVSGPDASVSINPDQFKLLISNGRRIKKTMGSKKIINQREIAVRQWAYRSVVSTRKIKKGEIILYEDIKTKRPSGGIPSLNYSEIIGKSASRDIECNTLIKWDDIT